MFEFITSPGKELMKRVSFNKNKNNDTNSNTNTHTTTPTNYGNIGVDELDLLVDDDDDDSDDMKEEEDDDEDDLTKAFLERENVLLRVKMKSVEECLKSIAAKVENDDDDDDDDDDDGNKLKDSNSNSNSNNNNNNRNQMIVMAKEVIARDLEIHKLREVNEEREKLLILLCARDVDDDEDANKERSISNATASTTNTTTNTTTGETENEEKNGEENMYRRNYKKNVKELSKMCKDSYDQRDAYEVELRKAVNEMEILRREKREAVYALEAKEKKCNQIESAREALEVDRDESRREMQAMKTELNANASKWRMEISALETRCALAEKKATLLLAQKLIENEQRDIDTEDDDDDDESAYGEEEEEEKKEKSIKKSSSTTTTKLTQRQGISDVSKAYEVKIKKELELSSAQISKSKRELEAMELKLGVVEVERDAANKSKKNLQVELEKALARESRVLTCLDSLEIEVTGFAEACAEIGVLDKRVATASKSPSWSWHPEFYDVSSATATVQDDAEHKNKESEVAVAQVVVVGENKANALFRIVIQAVEERFEALERAFQEVTEEKEQKSLTSALREEVKLAFMSARVSEKKIPIDTTTNSNKKEKDEEIVVVVDKKADADADVDDDIEERKRENHEIEALRNEVRELTETSELYEHELNEQLTESNDKCEELQILVKNMELSHLNSMNDLEQSYESITLALEDAKLCLNAEQEKVKSMENELESVRNEAKRQNQREIERRADQEMEMTFEIETLKRELASKTDRVAELESRLKSMSAKFEEIKRENGASKEISQSAQTEIQSLRKANKAEVEKLRIENQELIERVEDSNVRVHQLLQEIEAMDAASAEASEHVSQAMQAIKNASTREISALKAKLAEAEAFIEATEGMEDELVSTREEMTSLKENYSRRERELRGRIAELENIIEAVRLGRGRKVGVSPPHSLKSSPLKKKNTSIYYAPAGGSAEEDENLQSDDDKSENSFYVRTSSKADREQNLSAIKSVDKSLKQARSDLDRVRGERSRRLGFDSEQ